MCPVLCVCVCVCPVCVCVSCPVCVCVVGIAHRDLKPQNILCVDKTKVRCPRPLAPLPRSVCPATPASSPPTPASSRVPRHPCPTCPPPPLHIPPCPVPRAPPLLRPQPPFLVSCDECAWCHGEQVCPVKLCDFNLGSPVQEGGSTTPTLTSPVGTPEVRVHMLVVQVD